MQMEDVCLSRIVQCLAFVSEEPMWGCWSNPSLGLLFRRYLLKLGFILFFFLPTFEVFCNEIFKDIKGNVQGGNSVCLWGGHVVIFWTSELPFKILVVLGIPPKNQIISFPPENYFCIIRNHCLDQNQNNSILSLSHIPIQLMKNDVGRTKLNSSQMKRH